ncbi:MAG: GNAT family N-acetyltransferase [Alicyclobacillus sp.]|nr:GNAT family N-acetyltransferase [Alicyclobacillus sp.]
MKLYTVPMTHAAALDIASWRHDPPYDFYNLDGTEDAVNELLNGAYRSVTLDDGQLVGFYCLGESAQVPAGHAFGAYRRDGGDVVDVGIGMRPALTGRGFGSQFFAHVLMDIWSRHPHADLRLTVAHFNQRAIRLYEKFGFRHEVEFVHHGTLFETMRASAPAGDVPVSGSTY